MTKKRQAQFADINSSYLKILMGFILISFLSCKTTILIKKAAVVNYISDTIFTNGYNFTYLHLITSQKNKIRIQTLLYDSLGRYDKVYIAEKEIKRREGILFDSIPYIESENNINFFHPEKLFQVAKEEVFYKQKKTKLNGKVCDLYVKYDADSAFTQIDYAQILVQISVFYIYTIVDTDIPYMLKIINYETTDIKHDGNYSFCKENAEYFQEKVKVNTEYFDKTEFKKKCLNAITVKAPLHLNLTEPFF